MISYYGIDKAKWEKEFYYDYKIKEAFPMIDVDKIYKCVSILESESTDTVLRVIINEEEDEYVYIPSRAMIPVEILREKKIDTIIQD